MPKTEPFDKYLADYEAWFAQFDAVYQSELEAVRYFVPEEAKGIEIGAGSGLFAAPCGIREGVEPSAAMREKARERGVKTYDGVAGALPLADKAYDFALMVTTICFVDDPLAALKEALRILRPGGRLIIGFVDKESPVGQQYLKFREESVFYKDAHFYSPSQLLHYLAEAGFVQVDMVQTVFGQLDEIKEVQEFRPGYGKGSFVVLSAQK